VVRATKVVFAALGIGALVFLFQILTTAIFQLETRVTWLKDSLMDTTQELVDATPPNAKI
jgi:hypothetical protein